MNAARRLVFAIATLAAIDPFVPRLLAALESYRYERTDAFRFGSSDLFPIGPIVSYLREHPKSERSRTVFLGNSVIWGYRAADGDTIPARYQQLHPDVHVLNLGVNGFELGSSYLIAKAIAKSVDHIVLIRVDGPPNPSLSALIPIDDADRRAFRFERDNDAEQRFEARLGSVWQLYGKTYRLQAALFGSSTRQAIYRAVANVASARLKAQTTPVAGQPGAAAAPATSQAAVRTTEPEGLLDRIGELASRERVRITVLQLDQYPLLDAGVASAWSQKFAPYGSITTVHVPTEFISDGVHLTAEGAAFVAKRLP